MGLYRNIAGFGQVGLSLYQPGLQFTDLGTSLTTNAFSDPVLAQQQRDATQAAYDAEMNNEYDYLLNTSLPTLTAAGYYVYNDGTGSSGSIFKWNDDGHTASTAYLTLDWIQKIENERGTPGALLLHMQQPEIAKNTAGFEGGSSATWYADGGIDPSTQIVSDPIPAVQMLPATPSTLDTASANTSITPNTQALPVAAAPKNNFFPVAVVAGLGVVAIAGEPLLKKRRKVVYVGGIALLLYLMTQRT